MITQDVLRSLKIGRVFRDVHAEHDGEAPVVDSLDMHASEDLMVVGESLLCVRVLQPEGGLPGAPAEGRRPRSGRRCSRCDGHVHLRLRPAGGEAEDAVVEPQVRVLLHPLHPPPGQRRVRFLEGRRSRPSLPQPVAKQVRAVLPGPRRQSDGARHEPRRVSQCARTCPCVPWLPGFMRVTPTAPSPAAADPTIASVPQ